MTHQVALRREAYLALRDRKRPDESFSDTVLRLVREAPRDPQEFLRRKPKPSLSLRKHLALVEADRGASRARP